MAVSGVLGDDEVHELLQKRILAEEADSIRASLLWDGVVVLSETEGQLQWRRFPLGLLGRSGKYGCLCWVRKREEFCGQPIHGERSYFCSDHQKHYKGRAPCPLDPKHTVSISKLPGHLRVCQGVVLPPNIVPLRDSPFDTAVGGAGLTGSVAQVKQKVPIPVGAADTELDELAGLAYRMLDALWDCGAVIEASSKDDNEFDISRIVEVASKHPFDNETERPSWIGSRLQLRPRPTEILLPESCAPLVARAPPEGNKKARNGHHDVLQQASIAGHLDRAGWVPLARGEGSSQDVNSEACREENVCLVEFGAGSAHLSSLIAQVARRPIGWHMLIDRQVNRRTADERLRQGLSQQDADCSNASENMSRGAIVERMQCDICNFDLSAGLSSMLAKGNIDDAKISVVAVGKHICGVATDLSMRCCVQAASSSSDPKEPAEHFSKNVGVRFRGLAFAFVATMFANGLDMLGEIGCSVIADFNSMRWFAKLAHTQYRQREQEMFDLADPDQCRTCQPQSLSARAAAVRAELGHLSKRLIDEGRSAWLLQQG
eukprot:CAMPEP_0169193618 /NCGR_PEP_ID=MMETSP1016-20121227/6267_1 /TAXON_ID=342587 /ORGANISM="Karlodinium micrum, Strain CCMP2283" /LENGTH=545 /DNA_ID=CAMNT_0009270083 /DNA_START=33 /DNA_END=1668 /DNA_ORIENTATION=+